eukprot:Skav205208  [mRNA]  locus=scaffold376:196005:196373:- [translate_table: standard]
MHLRNEVDLFAAAWAECFHLFSCCCHQEIVHGVVLLNALTHHTQLRVHQGALHVGHSDRLVHSRVLVLKSHLFWGCHWPMLLPQLFVAPGREDEEGLQGIIICQNHATLPSVHQLVGLRRNR